jgi:hypothetical protein
MGSLADTRTLDRWLLVPIFRVTAALTNLTIRSSHRGKSGRAPSDQSERDGLGLVSEWKSDFVREGLDQLLPIGGVTAPLKVGPGDLTARRSACPIPGRLAALPN